MVIQTNELDICAGRYVDVPRELWSDVSRHNIRVISHVFVCAFVFSKMTNLLSGTTGKLALPGRRGRKMTIHVETSTVKLIRGMVLPEHALVSELAELLQDHEGIPINRQRISFEGDWLDFQRTLSDYDIPDGSTANRSAASQSYTCLALFH